jgi:hypothetical protein
LFSQKEFIDASRDFVCVRLESYESEEHQKMVRSFLNGRFENTAFCLLAPDGVERLSGTGRSPAMGLRAGRRGGRGAGGNDLVVDAMKGIAGKYSTKGKSDEIVVQDFHTFKQSLNVASGDQRLLLYVVAPESEREGLRKSLRPVLSDRDVIGRFHTDFAGEESDADWRKVIDGATSKAGLFIIRSDKFGQKGSVMAGLPLDAESKEIKSALLSANAKFAKSETRKVYSEHVSEGRRQQVYFENAMPYGEDRDGDGEIDHKGRGRGGPGGAGRPQGGPRGRGGPPEGRRGGPGRGGPGRGGPLPGEREGPPKARPGGR